MTSKERVRTVMNKQIPDRTPAAFQSVASVTKKLLKHYGFENIEQLYNKYEIDIRYIDCAYIGPKLKSYIDTEGRLIQTSFWGYEYTMYETETESYHVTVTYPLAGVETMEDLKAYQFPKTEWFDYTAITKACNKYPDKAIVIGHPGPFQMVTNLMKMDEFFMLMIDTPEVAQEILDKMVEFEVEHYRCMFEAANGKIDILRTHDDYGTQRALLFSVDMWRQFFKENTKKLVELAHEYDAFFMQHSCGAVEPIIEDLIACGVDAIEPVQKTSGMEIEHLANTYKGRIVFHGGVDTQWLLPVATAEEVKKETQCIVDRLGKDGGYILMASQSFETDVPIENIEAIYSVDRNWQHR